MSLYIENICTRIRTLPDKWKPLAGNSVYWGLTDGTIKITYAGLGILSSILDVYIDGKELPLGKWDRTRVELAMRYWRNNAPLSRMIDIAPMGPKS